MWDLAAAAQLATAQAQLASANASVASGQTQLQAAQTQLAQGQNQLSDSWNQLANGKTQLDAAREQLETSKTVLDKVGATLGKWEQTGITGKLYEQIRGKYDMAINQYNEACAEYNRQLNAYNAGLRQYQNAVARLDQGSQAYRSNADNLAQASKQIAEKQNELGKAVSQAGKQVADGVTQLIQGQRDIDKAETEYQSKLAEFNVQKPEVERKISEAERQITLAEEKIDNLTVPAYSVSGRREGLTSQGYRVYMVIEGIVAKLADIFPIFLYFVAALVTFSTMGRMVDEERTNSGTLKALGYGNADVMLKFTVYGFAASTLGTCIGVLAGHTLLPLIVAHAYSAGFTMPDIMLKFHPWITMAAFALAWISAVVPAWLAVSKELREKPASLLLPKPPAKGSKILLEHFPPLWNRLNFTHKVTARNIFRYKTRMFMTVFGVCGAVSLLTAGLAVQSSIGQIGNRQFEELIHYDLIVAEESDTNSAQREEIATTLKGKTVQSSTAVRYEELSKTAGKENDKQSITLLATDDAYNFNEYLTLRDRKTHQPQILVNNGAVISERLAEMLNVSVGDTFTVNDENGAQRTIKVAGISEMYIGHFIFMNAQCYEHVFGDQYSTNAYMV
ncbi:FtsX-like permease family protein, partial [Bifidobacterium adolescentis]|uniref:ABC transporter permease n=1 Tax=Bifidobacterium adolescentis TaxID=1680 RepID=UPI003D79C417